MLKKNHPSTRRFKNVEFKIEWIECGAPIHQIRFSVLSSHSLDPRECLLSRILYRHETGAVLVRLVRRLLHSDPARPEVSDLIEVLGLERVVLKLNDGP